jgi:hypothetical protein
MDHLTYPMQKDSGDGGGITRVPNRLLDRVMPGLRDSELRVLLVVRQTLGWQASPGTAQRKERDWLTQSQLMRRTGRASEAVARAVDSLVRGGLIDVLDRTGMPLTTPAERRRHLGRLYYRLGQGVNAISDGVKRPKTEHAKPNITKESRHKNTKAKDRIVDKSVENSVGTPVIVRTRGLERVKYPERTRWE